MRKALLIAVSTIIVATTANAQESTTREFTNPQFMRINLLIPDARNSLAARVPKRPASERPKEVAWTCQAGMYYCYVPFGYIGAGCACFGWPGVIVGF